MVEVLECGSCEELKLGVHATALGLAVVMGLYNAAAWLSRRQQHLAINAVLYAAMIAGNSNMSPTIWQNSADRGRPPVRQDRKAC